MALEEKISEDFKAALKSKDTLRVSCLRMLKTALKRRQVELTRQLTDEEVQAVISSSIRQGQDAVREFRAGGREDLASKEEMEIKFLYEYLPKQLSPDEIDAVLKKVIAETSAKGAKDLGQVMRVAMTRMAGMAQGKEVNERARTLLAQK